MKNRYGDVVFIAGASSGMGKAIAESLAKEGCKVYGTSRKVEMPGTEEQASKDAKGSIRMVQLDVCHQVSVDRAIQYVKEKEGRIDILINCAGFALAGSVEDTTHEEAFMEFNTNFFGSHRVCRSVAPIMRRQGRGLIINISSTAGLISVPFQAFYSASKYALEAITEGLRMELKPYGVRVALIEPGDTKTGFTNSRIYAKAATDSVYKQVFDKSVDRMIRDEQGGPPPVAVVNAVKRMIGSSNPPVRIVAGPINKLLAFLKKILPSRVAEFVVEKLYG
jgi:short-subunit dehydrogenase